MNGFADRTDSTVSDGFADGADRRLGFFRGTFPAACLIAIGVGESGGEMRMQTGGILRARGSWRPALGGAATILLVFTLAGRVRAQESSAPPAPTAQSDAPAFVTLQSEVTDPAAPSTSAVPSVAPGDSVNLEQRVHDLETIIKQMQAQQNGALPASANFQDALTQPENQVPPAPEPAPVPAFNPIGTEGEAPAPISPDLGIAGWINHGFYVESPDKAFMLHFTGQIQLDYREFLRTKDRSDIDTFLLRRARFGLEATLEKYYEFRFLPDFGQGTTIVQDAYMNIHYWNEFQFEVGRFKQPISYEQLIQDRYVPTLERSLIDQLVPQRDLGAMIHGEEVCNNLFDYAVSLSNGEINGNSTDLNDHKDLDGRFAIRPLNWLEDEEWLRWFQVGFSGGFGIEQEPINPATLRTPDTVPYFSFNSTVRADGLRTRLCPELAYFYGPVGFFAEYYDEHQDMTPTATGKGSGLVEDVPFRGYVCTGTCFLTGETRTTYSQQIFPLRNFDPRHPISSPGAWELVARVSHLGTGDIVYSKGDAQLANPATTANVATEYTLGFNWYFNGFFRMQFNYEHDMFNRSVLLGTSVADNELRSQDSLFTRFQIIF
jgi:phosphate-selective porin OprO and OprP